MHDVYIPVHERKNIFLEAKDSTEKTYTLCAVLSMYYESRDTTLTCAQERTKESLPLFLVHQTTLKRPAFMTCC